MPRHDQLFKDLFRTFLGDLVRLVAPEIAEQLELDRATFHDKELFTDLPEGDRAEASAAEFVERPEALAWGLAALMAWPSGDAVEHKLACLRPIALADLNDAERFQLFNIVETYVQLTDDEAKRWSDAVAVHPRR